MKRGSPFLASRPSWLTLPTGWPHPEHAEGTVQPVRSPEPTGGCCLLCGGERKSPRVWGEELRGGANHVPSSPPLAPAVPTVLPSGTGVPPCPGAGCKRGFASVGLCQSHPRLSCRCPELGGSVAATACSAPRAAAARGRVCAGEAGTARTVPGCFPESFGCRRTPSPPPRARRASVSLFPTRQCRSSAAGKPR